MSAATSIKLKSYRKAFMLIGVYCLHLIFFQALLQAEPSNFDNNFKPLFHHSHNNPQVPKHPAVTYYIMMQKLGNETGGACHNVTPAIHQINSIVALPAISSALPTCPIFIRQFHIADDIFKVYRLIHVFLI